MATKVMHWSREQLLVALHLYCQLPFGKMHQGNPDIIRFSELIGRTPSALAMKLTNIASLDPAITSTGRRGLPGASATDKAMWLEMQADWEHFLDESQAAIEAFAADRNVSPDASLDEQTDFAPEYTIDYCAENRPSQTQIRIGQSFFRRSVISAKATRRQPYCSLA